MVALNAVPELLILKVVSHQRPLWIYSGECPFDFHPDSAFSRSKELMDLLINQSISFKINV